MRYHFLSWTIFPLVLNISEIEIGDLWVGHLELNQEYPSSILPMILLGTSATRIKPNTGLKMRTTQIEAQIEEHVRFIAFSMKLLGLYSPSCKK